MHCPVSQSTPLGRGPLPSSNLCLLLNPSPLGTLMRGVWRKSFPRPWAGLKRTRLPWCALFFCPDSTVATEGGFPLGEWALESHLSEESDGWDGIFCCGSHGNMSMNPLNAPLILLLRIGCDVKLHRLFKRGICFGVGKQIFLWESFFSCFFFYKNLIWTNYAKAH